MISDEQCTATLKATGFRAATVRLAPGKCSTVTLKPSKQRAPRKITVRVRAVDAEGNIRALTRKLTLR